MKREKHIALIVVVLVTLFLISGYSLMFYLGQKSWSGQTTETWTGRAPQQGK